MRYNMPLLIILVNFMKFKKGNIPHNIKDLTGMSFGHLSVLSRDVSSKSNQAKWICKCHCGKELSVTGNDLRSGQYSCGCTRYRKRTHGKSNSRTYRIWVGMIQRCTNPNISAYKYYGGRGISVCDRWMNFENFYADMGDSNGFSIERINNDEGYSPENCKWVGKLEQTKNKRNVRLVDGLTSGELSKKLNIKTDTIRYRIKHGVDLTKPVGRKNQITYKGITLCQKEWAEKLNLRTSTISMRLKKGLPIDKVLKEFDK